MLIFDNNLINFLHFSSRTSITSQILMNGSLEYIIECGNYIKMVDDEIDCVSYLPVAKYEKVEDVWNNNSRVKIRIGRFIKKFINQFSVDRYNIDDKEIENFVNVYKSYFAKDKSNLVVVSGDDIKKYYLESNYFSISGRRYGTLWNSCMRQKERNNFMELYCVNDVKMLVSLSEDGKVKSRALLWDKVTDVNTGNEYKFMDRIYSFFDHDVILFKDWAKENGYITKYEQNAKTEIHFRVDGKHTAMELKVELPNHEMDYYPYLDTFKYYDNQSGIFYNTPRTPFLYKLVQSNGMMEPEPREPEYDDYDDDVEDEF